MLTGRGRLFQPVMPPRSVGGDLLRRALIDNGFVCGFFVDVSCALIGLPLIVGQHQLCALVTRREQFDQFAKLLIGENNNVAW